MGWGFDIFVKFAVKFPAHGQIIPVKCNQISPPQAAHCAVKYLKAGPKKGTIKISPNKTLKSLFILRCCITKDSRVPVTAASIHFNHNPCYTAYNTETFKSTFCKFKYTVLSNGQKETHFYKLTVIVVNEPYIDQFVLPSISSMRPCLRGSHVACLNFKTSVFINASCYCRKLKENSLSLSEF